MARSCAPTFSIRCSWSLSQQMIPVARPEDIRIGDAFVQGGFPGHAAIILDVALNPVTGEKVFLLAQSYMPAQEIHVLLNPSNAQLSPWYSAGFGERLETPEWTFAGSHLRRFTPPAGDGSALPHSGSGG